MDLVPVSSDAAMAAAVKQLQALTEIQTEIMKDLTQSQENMAELLQAAGIGQNVDIRA